MTIKTLIPPVALTGSAISAHADNVTTPTGDIFMIEKNKDATTAGSGAAGAGALGGLAAALPLAAIVVTAVVSAAGQANSGTDTK